MDSAMFTFSASSSTLASTRSDCIVIGVLASKSLSRQASFLNEHSGGLLSSLIRNGELTGKNGEVLSLFEPAKGIKKVMLISFDPKSDIDPNRFREAISRFAKKLASQNIKKMDIFLDDITVEGWGEIDKAKTIAEKLTSNSYKFSLKQKVSSKKSPVTVNYHFAKTSSTSKPTLEKALSQGAAVGQGINTAKELGNLPGNICTPSFLAKEARKLAKNNSLLNCKVLSEKQMQALGMNSLLSVSAGSHEPAQLIVMEYRGAAKSQKPYVLVGKGITFDTGGISLKPGAAMDEMKFDMCGAASVFGTMQALLATEAKVNVVGIVAAAENMPGSKATKPGDIVTSMSGKTIEILNTDAEGRLVLCDALSYAERYKPRAVIDIATLTGACVIALGAHASGLFSNNDELAQTLLDCGDNTGDRAWRMPIWDDYRKQLDSNFADLANIGGKAAGSITAACFLSHFTENYPWAHIDIAGTAWLSGKNKGATGRPVALLTDYLLSR